MRQSDVTPRTYSQFEEVLNAFSHGIGSVLACLGLILLLIKGSSTLFIFSSFLYGISLILMFVSSTAYHSVTRPSTKSAFKLLDHSAIYLLIAGTYTPYLLHSIGGETGWIGFCVIWFIALAGVVFKCLARNRFPKIALSTYLVMGWLALLLIYSLYKSLPFPGFVLLVCGGVCFSVGAGFYAAKSRQYTHFIWHLWVIAGAACHYASIYYYVY